MSPKVAAEAPVDYETVIGLEVHAQVLTRSKMFCRCSADYASAPPNTLVCPVCLGMPGVLPVINRRAIEATVMTALALHCTIPPSTKFDRKNYPYPDLMKGYQISQYDAPIGRDGWLEIPSTSLTRPDKRERVGRTGETDGATKRVGILRVHQEEDTAKLLHRTDAVGPDRSGRGRAYSLVDVNRSGVPLMEVVGQPDLRSPEEARQYLIKLRSILQYLEVCTGNMEEGSFRCDANLSIRPRGTTELLAKVEVKNMNSFKAVFRALSYEEERQRRVLREGGRIEQETRGWVEDRGITVLQRSKEYAHDYRYFPEPDLPPLSFDRGWLEALRARLPELPDARRERFMAEYALSAYDARLLTESKALADFFEACLPSGEGLAGDALKRRAKQVSNWLLGEFSRLLNAASPDTSWASIEVTQSKVAPGHLSELLDLLEDGTLSQPMAKAVFEEMFHTGKAPRVVVEEKGMAQISQAGELEGVVAAVLQAHPQAVADYRSGKATALTYLVGQVMKATRGQANPALVNRLLREKLEVSER